MRIEAIKEETKLSIQNIPPSYLQIATVILLLSTNITQQVALAQTTNGNFLIYESHTYGFKIQYPSNWEKLEFSQGIEEEHRNIVVNFLSPTSDASNTFRDYLIIEVGNVTSQNASLVQYADTQINLRRSLPNFNLLESTSATVSEGYPAYKIIYTFSNPIAGITKVMDILTIKGDKLYFLSYNGDVAKYSLYLPTIEKMINSFLIINN